MTFIKCYQLKRNKAFDIGGEQLLQMSNESGCNRLSDSTYATWNEREEQSSGWNNRLSFREVIPDLATDSASQRTK